MKASYFYLVLTVAALALSLAPQPSAYAASVTPENLARGRSLVVFGTCNDCHTAGWRESDGSIPQTNWMTGSKVGFRGWWGTSYPTNVRLEFQVMSESSWISAVRTRAGHPPMIWQDLRGVPDADLRAIYQFIRSLGPKGSVMPAAVEPWREPVGSYIDMRVPPAQHAP